VELQQTQLKQPRLMDINLSQISQKFRDFDFDGLAKLCGFTKSTAQKITPFMFITSFFASIGKEQFSLQDWANSLMSLFQVSASKQAFDKRTSTDGQANYCEEVAKWAVSCTLNQEPLPADQLALLSSFGGVYVQDSSCCKLSKGCQEEFPGASNGKNATAATARIQLTIDLATDQPIDLLVSHFRKNDQGDASRVVPMLKSNDLLIRDQGYFVLGAFREITEREAYFLSRLKPGSYLYALEECERFDTLKFCKKKLKSGICSFEIPALLGKEDKLPVRVLFQEVPQNVYQERRRKAIKDRSSKANHSKEYLDLLQWQILITNAPVEKMTVEQGMKIYALRWRIEIIFKCWKSELKLDKRLAQPSGMKATRAKIIIYLFLAYVILFAFQSYLFVSRIIRKKYLRKVSIIKWFQLVREDSGRANAENLSDELLYHISRACTYDKRSRQHYQQKMDETVFG
jgi:hypothetical protein